MGKDGTLLEQWGTPEDGLLAGEIRVQRGLGRNLIDLATQGVGTHDLQFPEIFLRPTINECAHSLQAYHPESLGTMGLRRQIAIFLEKSGTTVAPENIVIGPGTSLLYFYLFRILVERGGEILIPSPGYPLLEDLATIAGISTRRYHLKQVGTSWEYDMEELEFQITPRTRAICLVAPHNPLGISPTTEGWRSIGGIATHHGLAVIVDEVFSSFHGEGHQPPPIDRMNFPLLIRLNGLSKMLFLPGLKIAWLAMNGKEEQLAPLRNALERMSDAFLPVSDVATSIAAEILPSCDTIIGEFRREVNERRRLAVFTLEGMAHDPGAGAYLVLPTNRTGQMEEIAIRVLRETGVLVHPGEYYDLPGHLVLCCLARNGEIRDGCSRLVQWIRMNGLAREA